MIRYQYNFSWWPFLAFQNRAVRYHWQKFPANVNNAYRCLPMLADAGWWFANITDDNWCYRCLTDAGKCSPNGDQSLPDGSRLFQCCQPSKSCKNWWKNQKNRTNMSWQHCFRLKQPINYLIPWLTSVISATIGYIGYPLISFGKHYWHWWGTQCIFGHRQQS